MPVQRADTALHRFIRNAPHPIAVTAGGTHRVATANAGFCELAATDPATVVGNRIEELFPGEYGTDICTLLDRCLKDGQPTKSRYTPSRADYAPYALTIWPLAPEGPEPAGLVIEMTKRIAGTIDVQAEASADGGNSEDFADQIRRINGRLLQAALDEQEWADRAEAASRAKSEFLAMVSHELRTPLTGIVAYTELLLEQPDLLGPITDQQRSSLERIANCSEHLRQLIEDLLLYASLESGAATIKVERVDVGELARQAAAVIQPIAANKGLQLTVREPEHPVALDTDTRRLRQILLNLIGNAVKFTDSGSILVAARDEGPVVRFDVEDTGIGIEEADLARIFEPFVQSESITTRRHGGTGLGLAISRDLARLLGGDVVVRSTPGNGSIFSLTLPRTPAEPPT